VYSTVRMRQRVARVHLQTADTCQRIDRFNGEIVVMTPFYNWGVYFSPHICACYVQWFGEAWNDVVRRKEASSQARYHFSSAGRRNSCSVFARFVCSVSVVFIPAVGEHSAIPRSVRLSVPWHSCPRRAAAVGYRHANCLQPNHRRPRDICRLRTRPRTDVDPPRVELPSAGGISSRRPRGDNLSSVNLFSLVYIFHCTQTALLYILRRELDAAYCYRWRRQRGLCWTHGCTLR